MQLYILCALFNYPFHLLLMQKRELTFPPNFSLTLSLPHTNTHTHAHLPIGFVYSTKQEASTCMTMQCKHYQRVYLCVVYIHVCSLSLSLSLSLSPFLFLKTIFHSHILCWLPFFVLCQAIASFDGEGKLLAPCMLC